MANFCGSKDVNCVRESRGDAGETQEAVWGLRRVSTVCTRVQRVGGVV